MTLQVSGWLKSAPKEPLDGQVTFLKMTPGTHLRPHMGSTNDRLILQMPLLIPDGLVFRVANETRTYNPDRVLIFDDSFEHEVKHTGSEGDRYVLYMTVHHPDLNYDLVRGQAT